ncbi:MAG: NAD(P)-dependent oxidoreductase [Christensenellaceae bacterium]|jgi:3-hydroxyisobutyrate dehydrogenase/2-hydroxy-3-oxopropionate reductase|nr:NAD(P)-dependent oxidoreductase [Christensenellaceae bacterium]
MKIAFIGVGVMGKSMVRNLMKKGHELHIYSRTKAKTKDVIDEGAVWHDSVAGAVSGAEAVITIVGYPKDVEEVYFGQDGILESAGKGALLIDMTTTSPKLAERICAQAKAKGLRALDAPVSGGDVGARNATLAIMVGGDESDFEAARPIFEALGQNIRYEGKAGNGQHTKMANQIALGGAIAGVCEAISYARAAGLDVQTMLDTISTGAAGSWQMLNMAPRMLKGDFDPGFFVKHYIKDLNIASEEAGDRKVSMPVAAQVLEMYLALEKAGHGDLGTQALIKFYEK